jgi:two-component system OmpR family response regulator
MQVLLVEDDELICARLQTLLAPAQFDVQAVASARDAREMTRAVVFPIVIIDRMLGDSDGISLIGELRRSYEQHRVFLMLFSSLDSESDRRAGMAAGADDYVSKRATDDELLARLAAARAVVKLRSK